MAGKQIICLITVNHLASNPRLVKEAIALKEAGYGVHIIFTQNLNRLAQQDCLILNEHPLWKTSILDWTGNSLRSKYHRIYSGMLMKISERWPWTAKWSVLKNIAVNRHFSWQLRQAKKAKAHLYIAHTLGALPVACEAAAATNAKAGFDAEDFHRYEVTDDPSSGVVKEAIGIEDIYLPGLSHFTAASPLIAEAYGKLYPVLRPTVILNVFPQPYLTRTNKESKKIRLFWFSQTIGENRGIEQVVEAMSQLDANSCELHLLGNVKHVFKDKLQQLADGLGLKSAIFFYPPCAEKEIFSAAAGCDIGVASETGIPYNREICLTNKIFTYIQSGIAVLASNTIGQTNFLTSYPSVGRVYKNGCSASLASAIRYYQNNPDELEACKRSNLQLAREKLNWEREQAGFISLVESTLQ